MDRIDPDVIEARLRAAAQARCSAAGAASQRSGSETQPSVAEQRSCEARSTCLFFEAAACWRREQVHNNNTMHLLAPLPFCGLEHNRAPV